ncbi:maltase 2 [Anoplophora glabripennis]|nr:maltase 2 [Anoplophora glabripennis]
MKIVFVFVFSAIAVVSGLEIEKPKNEYLLARNDAEPDWWQTAVFYQIYPRSFKDSDNDGIGDIRGIIDKLPHLYDMKVTAVWLSPIFTSPQVDQGYDISDYYSIDPDYGTLDDLRELVDKAHELDIKIVLDFVPNHTSDQHEWFQESVNNATGEFGDYYVWRDCEKDEDGIVTPPNNWLSHFGGSAWEYNEERDQCYLHQFAAAQPDLNFNNPDVVTAIELVLTYWLEFGIDGFRCDAVGYLFEDPEFRDEPLSNIPDVGEDEHDYLDHIYTADQPQTYDMIYQWRELLDSFTETNQSDTKVMMTETYTSIENTLLYYGLSNGTRKGAHFAFNFNFITKIAKGFNVEDLTACISEWLDNLPSIYTSNWVLGNHDVNRVATRFGTEYIDAFNMLTAFLPGVMVTYNGEEIGMENGEVTCEQGHDPRAINDCSTFNETSRDFARTPFHWDNTTNAGFNDGATPWLPVSEKYLDVNLADQDVRALSSHYNVYKELLQFRSTLSRMEDLDEVTMVSLSDNVIQIIRQNKAFHVSLVFNVGEDEEAVEFNHWEGDYVVAITTIDSSYSSGDFIENGTLFLNPYESIVIHNTVVSGGPSAIQVLSYLVLLCSGVTMSLF